MQQLIDMLGMRFHYTRELMIVGLILARTLPMIFMTPFLAGQTAPPEVKMGLGILLSILAWPLVRNSMTAEIPFYAMPFLVLMLKETFVGFTIGFTNSHIFAAMETAGRFIDTARGAAMSEVMNPASRTRATAIGTLYQQLLLVFFVALGGHHIYIDTFFQSFAQIPINESIDLTPGMSPMAYYCLKVSSDVMSIATILAAPAIAATFITDLVFGILNRVAPQLNAYFMSMPVKAMGALALVLCSLSSFFSRLEHYIGESLVAVKLTVQLLMHR